MSKDDLPKTILGFPVQESDQLPNIDGKIIELGHPGYYSNVPIKIPVHLILIDGIYHLEPANEEHREIFNDFVKQVMVMSQSKTNFSMGYTPSEKDTGDV